MKRFWLLLLALVLPLQMSWAAVHFCDDELKAAGAQSVQTFPEPHVHQQAEKADKLTGSQGDALADACCGAAHGCHGLHNLMAPTNALVAAPDDVSRMTAADCRQAQRFFSTRHERPQWPAA